jgi:hypothetical protein
MVDIFTGSYSLTSIRLDSADIAECEDEGGQAVSLYGLYRDETARVSLFLDGSPGTLYPCYGGLSGQGYLPHPVFSGMLTLATPRVPTGFYRFKVQQSTETFTSDLATVPFGLTVRVRNWRTRVFSLRRVMPPWYRTGPRILDNVGLLS